MSLYNIYEEIRFIADNGFGYDPETGEVVENEDAMRRMEELQVSKETKVENLACYVKNLLSEAAELKAEEASLKHRRQQKEKRAESIKGFLGRLMAAYGEKKVETTRAVVQLRTAQAVEISDEKEFLAYAKFQNASLVRAKDPEPNKEEIKRRLKAGEDIPGVTLVTRESVGVS